MPDTAEISNLIGRTLGNYQITEQIGQGGMAAVYKAFQFTIDRYVAVKILPSQFAKDPNFVKRFEHEAKSIAALEHPHILPVHDFGVEGDLYYMVMRYIEGGTLSKVMGRAMPYEQIVQYVGDIARALDYAHRQGVVHRDIKPSNILIDQHGEVLLTDFGIAKIVTGASSTQLTATGDLMGTPAYMSPEQAQSIQVDRRSDIYSLGVILYELLTGQPPYQAETPLAIALKHINEPLPPPRQLKSDIPQAFESVVLKAMAKEPGHRFDTAEQMAQALQVALKESSETGQILQPPASPDIEASQLGQIAPTLASGTKAVDQPVKTQVDDAPTIVNNNNSSRFWLVVGGVIFVGLAALGIGGWFLASPPSEPDVVADSVSTTAREEVEVDQIDEEYPEYEEDEAIVFEDILFEDDFSDGNTDIWFQEAIENEFGIATTEISQGRYIIEVIAINDEGNSGWGELLIEEFDDFILTVEVFPPEAEVDLNYGVFFRNSRLDLVEFTSDVLFEEEPFELTIEAVGPSITFFINGDLIATAIEEDDTGDARTIGFYLELFEEGEVSVEFDNVVIEAP